MYKSIFRHIANALALLPVLFAAASCVNKEYVIDEDKINLEVNIFQEGVVIPVGTTDVIKVKDLVSMLDEEYQQYLKASWMNDLGLSANYNMKREAINSG